MTHPFSLPLRHLWLPFCLGAALSLQGCGGSGGDGGTQESVYGATGPVYFDAPHTASSRLAGQCEDLRQKQFIRSYLDETYLWPEQVQRQDARAYRDAPAYFDSILAPLEIDRFSYSITAHEADLQENAVAFDAGIYWLNTGSSTAPVWRVSRVDPGSPADIQGIRRGDTLVGDLSTNQDSPSGPYFYNFSYLRNDRLTAVSLVPTVISEDPVGSLGLLTKGSRRVGYLAFDAHFGNAQDQLIQQIQQARLDDVNELVVDLRYNQGGFLYIAGSLASMLAPQTVVSQQPVFVRLLPNAKLQTQHVSDVLRLSSSVQYTDAGAAYREGSVMPNLNLTRVYVLTTGATCSASEALINGLRGIGVTVHVIGNTTCGKPYAASRQENCGVAYFPITMRGVNALGTSDFVNGFTPTCQVDDDLNHERGDPREALLGAALQHMETGTCPVNTLVSNRSTARTQMSEKAIVTGSGTPQRSRPVLTLVTPR